MKTLRLALAQINCTVGDLQGNCRKISDYIRRAEKSGAEIVIFPELAITGYPPEDLLLKPKFISDNLNHLKQLVRSVKKTIAVVGFVDRQNNLLYNAAAVLYRGKIQGIYYKILLPNYGVFDEKRYFSPGTEAPVFEFGELKFGLNICEDIWHRRGPLQKQAKAGAKLILNLNASPFHAGKVKEREAVIQAQARANRLPIAYVNLVGGQDELVFDGQSMVVDAQGKVIARAAAFKEDLLVVDSSAKARRSLQKSAQLAPEEEVYGALTLGLHDYCIKNGFKKVVIGLSGGIDSALVACLAVDALGCESVTGVFMPSRYTSQESESDAKELAENLGIKLFSIPIEEMYKAYLGVFAPHFAGLPADITEENLQARIRGNILMALSNKFGWLVLTTGNKSEMSTGYATLYGDMAGGLAVIKDVPKTLVYKLSKYRNTLKKVIPERVFTKAPTAELKPNQKDQDTLPPYDTLDAILKAYVEDDKELSRITALGLDKETVRKVLRMVDKSEYKRRQSPPGVKITHRAFGKDRRMPITNGYEG